MTEVIAVAGYKYAILMVVEVVEIVVNLDFDLKGSN
jgi:hypothetical protein